MLGHAALAELALSAVQGGQTFVTPSLFDRLIDDPSIERCYLVEATIKDPSGNPVPVRLSTHGYRSDTAYYDGRLANPLNFGVNLFASAYLSGRSRVGAGEIEIRNDDGGLDGLLDHAWDASTLEVKLGTEDAAITQFASVFKGRAEQITWDERTIRVRLRDRQVDLDKPVQDTLYAGTGGLEGGADLKGKPKPVCLGKVLNISPVLVDTANRVYQVHDGPIQAVVAVYFAGLAATAGTDYSVDLNAGTITLLVDPGGDVTADVEGHKPASGYASSAADLVRRLVVDYGGLDEATELDLASFAEVNGLNSAVTGYYTGTGGARLGTALDEIMASVGGFWGFARDGRLRVGIVREPGTPVETFTGNDIKQIRRVASPRPAWRTRIGYQRVWTTQDRSALAGAVSDSRVQFLGEPFRYEVAEDASIRALHPLAVEREVPALFDAQADASAEAARQHALFSADRDVYEVEVHHLRFSLDVGDRVRVQYGRFGLDAGRDFVVVAITENVRTDTMTLRLWG